MLWSWSSAVPLRNCHLGPTSVDQLAHLTTVSFSDLWGLIGRGPLDLWMCRIAAKYEVCGDLKLI